MKHKAIFFLIACLFYLSCIFSIYAESVKITTWNTEWLLSPADILSFHLPKDIQFKTSSDILTLSHYIKQLNSDILALQEVGSIEAAKQIISTQNYNFFITDDVIAQHTLIAIRKNLSYQVKKNPDLTPLNMRHANHHLRSGLDITLYKNNYSLRILNIHLKAGCQENAWNAPKPSCLLLNQQHIILQEWINQRIKEKQPFLILGDFNRVISLNDYFFNNLPISLTIPTSGIATPCWNGNYFIDGFILDKHANQWLQKNSLKVMLFHETNPEAKEHLSDHCPVSINLSLP